MKDERVKNQIIFTVQLSRNFFFSMKVNSRKTYFLLEIWCAKMRKKNQNKLE